MAWSSMEEAKSVVTCWIIEQGESFAVPRGYPKKWVALCRRRRQETCEFRIRISLKNGNGVLTVLKPHTCPSSAHDGWRVPNSIKFLASNQYVQELVADDTNISVRTLQRTERMLRGNRTKYLQQWRTREYVRKVKFGDEKKSYRRLPALLSAFEDAHTRLETEEGTHRFERCWVIPEATIEAARHCRRFAALDGTRCRTRYRLTLLAVTILDGNNETLVIAMALVRAENIVNWTWFLEGLRPLLPWFDEKEWDPVFISDRLKGIKEGVRSNFPIALHSYCCQHIADNITQAYGEGLRQPFWEAVHAPNKQAFKKALQQIEMKSVRCGTYLKHINPKRWAVYAFSRPRFGHVTSNIQESVNAHWLEARNLPAVYLLARIWNGIMQKIYTRQHKQHKTDRITDSANVYLKSEFTLSRRFKIESSNRTTAMVTLGIHQWTVKLEEGTCTCRAFQNRRIPCRHAIAVCRDHNLEPEDYVSDFYKMEAYRNTYKMSMPPVRVEDLEENDSCIAPRWIKPKGRPRKRRIRKGVSNANKKVRRCSYCGSSRHNRKTCDRASDEENDSAGSADDSDATWEGIAEEEEEEEEEEEDWQGFDDIEPIEGGDGSGLPGESISTAVLQEKRKREIPPSVQKLIDEARAAAQKKRQEEDALLFSPPHSPTPSLEDDPDDGNSEAEANWAMAEDPEEAQFRWYMSEDSGPAGGAHWATALDQHLAYKASNPEEAARGAKRKKEFLANKNRHRLTAEQLKVIFPPRPSLPDHAAAFRNFLAQRRARISGHGVEEAEEEAVGQQGESRGIEERAGQAGAGQAGAMEVEEGAGHAQTQASGIEEREEPVASTRPRRKAAVAAEAAWASLKPSGKRPRAISAIGLVESPNKKQTKKGT